MKKRETVSNAPTLAQKRALLQLSAAAEGQEWDSPAVAELAAFIAEMRVPYHVFTFVGGAAVFFAPGLARSSTTVESFVRGARMLARCTDYGEPPSAECNCLGCERRRESLPQHFTREEQSAAEARVGSFWCDIWPRFEGGPGPTR